MRTVARSVFIEWLIWIALTLQANHANGRSGDIDPCRRRCLGPRLRCHYSFKIQLTQTMGHWCRHCNTTKSDCYLPNCVTADGSRRLVYLINNALPGPDIQVCHGDVLYINVTNEHPSESMTIHWHGIHQRGSQFMDGVPMLTQCPISPGQTFQYVFTANPVGTMLYHAHSGEQEGEGIFGALVIRQPRSKEREASRLFDRDEHEHVVVISDFYPDLAMKLGVHLWSKLANGEDNVHESAIGSSTSMDMEHLSPNNARLSNVVAGERERINVLINGKGRLYDGSTDRKLSNTPLAWFNVTRGYRYRFRLINGGTYSCPAQFSVEGHRLTVIGSDEGLVDPVDADNVILYSGERYDVVIKTASKSGNYWIKVKLLQECDNPHDRSFQVAVLHYDDAVIAEPDTVVTHASSAGSGVTVNPLTIGASKDDFPITRLTASGDTKKKSHASYSGTPTKSYFFDLPFIRPKWTPEFLQTSFAKHGIYIDFGDKEIVQGSAVNNITMAFPASPPLTQDVELDICNSYDKRRDPPPGLDYTPCFHMYDVDINDLVEITFINDGVNFQFGHPMHLHGQGFRVVQMGQAEAGRTVNTKYVQEMSNKRPKKLFGAPVKDTVLVQPNGWTTVRFNATNPGYWLFHCHISGHMIQGMTFVIRVNDTSAHLGLPEDFPTCGSFAPREINKWLPNNYRKEYGHIGG